MGQLSQAKEQIGANKTPNLHAGGVPALCVRGAVCRSGAHKNSSPAST